MERIKIMIVDDHPFFRQGIKFYLDSLTDIEFVGEAENGEEAFKIIETNEVDVVLMDLQMPKMDGITVTTSLLKSKPELRILILTSFGNDSKVKEALAIGAAGYCLKDAPPEELVTAIRAVAEGGTYLGRGINSKNLTSINDETDDEANQLLSNLTNRELDVLKLLAKGLGNKEIAERLFVSEKTVKTHVANLLQKMEVKTRTQAAILANKLGVS